MIILLKFLLACTPNGAVMYISPLYVGSISDVQLTRVCGFLDVLRDQNISGMSVMADRGFTIKDHIEKIGAKLNIPPFLDGRQQLQPEDISTGRRIASLRTRGSGHWESEELFHSQRCSSTEYEPYR